MLELDRKYKLLDEISINEENEIENDLIKIKILQQDKIFIINNLTSQTTILQLKERILKEYKINILQQRLIYCGKPLQPNEKILNDFNIKNDCIIHLFIRPLNNTTSNSNNNSTASAAPSSNNNNNTSDIVNPLHNITTTFNNNSDVIHHLPIHFDPQIGQSLREVRMWSYILVIISAMTIFSNLSYLGSTGHFGNGSFDGVLNIIEGVRIFQLLLTLLLLLLILFI